MNVKKCNFAPQKPHYIMTITVPPCLPAIEVLAAEGLTNLSDKQSESEALKILVVNLMPKKAETEADILRMLCASPLDLDITFALPSGHVSKNTPQEHIQKFYHPLHEVEKSSWDGMIVTGAPLDFVEYEDVDYWQQICTLIDWSHSHVRSTLWVCWGAFAALYHRYGINKHALASKLSGVFSHMTVHTEHPLMQNMSGDINVPHSRHVAVSTKEILERPNLKILAYSAEAGVYLLAERNSRDIMMFGHPEYNAFTLHSEYVRDLGKGINPHIPDHYYPDNNPELTPHNQWRNHAATLYRNWISRLVAPQ